MVSFSDLFTYTLVVIAIITLVSNRKEKQPPRPEKTSDYIFLVNLLFQNNRYCYTDSTFYISYFCLSHLSTITQKYIIIQKNFKIYKIMIL